MKTGINPDYIYLLPPNRARRNYRGGALLDALQNAPAPVDGDQPEDWIASTTPASNPGLAAVPNEGLATVVTQDGSIHLVKDLFAQYPEHFLGQRHFATLGTELGFLAKLLDSAMRLHVQAHPTAEFAGKYLNSRWGKLETYVILQVRNPDNAYLRLGFQHPPSPEEWKRIVYEQDIPKMDNCFDPVSVAPGEAWVVPGGLPHAIGEGLLVLEVMEPTDLVVRCEFEREGIIVPPPARFMQREPDFAMRIFDYTPMPEEKLRQKCQIRPITCRADNHCTIEQVIGPQQTDCFRIFKNLFTGNAMVPGQGCVTVGIVSDGYGRINAGGKSIEVKPGSYFMAAAATDAIEYIPDSPQLLLYTCIPGL